MIEAYFDGVCEPVNPKGHAAWGAIILVDSKEVFAEGGYVGVGHGMSNNVAEYTGVIRILQELPRYQGVAIIRGDSKLVIMQLYGKNGARWRVHGGAYVPFYHIAMKLLEPLRERVKMEWIPRDKNEICDVLSKKVLKDMGIAFRIQPEARRSA